MRESKSETARKPAGRTRGVVTGIVILGLLGGLWALGVRDEPRAPSGERALDTTPAPLDSLAAGSPGDRERPGIPEELLADLEREVESLEETIRANPDDPMPRLELSMRMRDLGREDEAARLVLEAYEVAPDRPEAIYNLAMYRMAMKQWDEAEAAFEELLRIEPGNTSARLTLDRLREARAAAAADPPATSP